jgi:hypothetical protein
MADTLRPDWGRAGRALALLTALALASGCLPGEASAQSKPAQTKAEPTKPPPSKPAPATPAPASPGAPISVMPWAHPALPNFAPPTMAPAQGPTQGPTPVTAAQLRPADRNLIDCKQAPKNAVTQLPETLSRWATIYCTRQGHILTTNERFYSAIPGTQGKLRGVIGAAAINNQNGDVGHGAYFTKIEYTPLVAKTASALTAGVDAKVVERVKDKPLFQLTLTTDKGKVYRGVVVDPEHDPFWVIPIVNDRIGQTGFYVATVDYVNKTRMQ